MHFHTLSGELIVTPDKDGYTMDFPAGQAKPISVTDAIREATNGLAKEAYYDDGQSTYIYCADMDKTNRKRDSFCEAAF